ncbi:hypothetical protein [Xanthomonas euvesicatoria]|uniref:hypothetical protein n=1 Tax=Xanthomonas euvesicatoria TaxID=456327 RepID=UPI0026E2E9BC|nr:hypothetical protein [Xanthomonas euvesicatoria]MDO7934208.1 hypothetical protein [Xanthomonas euvesicatoria pv. eucalypti]
MNYRRVAPGAKFWLWVALFVAYSAAAVSIVMIDTADHRYQPLSVKSTSVTGDEQQRRRGASQVAAVYRASSAMPFSTLPAGSTFQVVWPDGSTETMTVVDPSSASGIVPVPGSQQAPAPRR